MAPFYCHKHDPQVFKLPCLGQQLKLTEPLESVHPHSLSLAGHRNKNTTWSHSLSVAAFQSNLIQFNKGEDSGFTAVQMCALKTSLLFVYLYMCVKYA